MCSFNRKYIGIQTAPQPYYQPSQFGGMSAIPSPPAVLYNSSPMPSQYGHYERYITSAHYGAGGNAGKNHRKMCSLNRILLNLC